MAKKATVVKPTPIDAHETFVSIRKSFAEGGEIREKLRALYGLQTIDTELDKIYQLRGELPEEVAALEDKIASLSGQAASVSDSIMDAEKKIAELRAQKQQNLDRAAKYQAQVDEGVGNSREFDSLSKEKAFEEMQAEVADKRIYENLAVIEELQARVEEIRETILARQEDLKAKKEELEVISASTAKDEEKLLAKRAGVAENIDARTMSAYERIRKSVKNHIAVAAIYQDSCGGCHTQITPQGLIDIAAGKKPIICEYCGRILVDPSIIEEEAEPQQ